MFSMLIDSLPINSVNNSNLGMTNNHQSEFLPRLIPPSNIKLWSRARTYSDEVLVNRFMHMCLSVRFFAS